MKFWIVLLVVIGLIGGAWGLSRSMRMEARAEAPPPAVAAAPGLVPYDGPYDPIPACPPDSFKPAGASECVAKFVERGTFGGCPSGYVDHPFNPKQCTLPAIAAQYDKRR